MKSSFTIVLISILFINTYGQTINWAKKGGLWAYDYGYGIANDPAGNLYVAGKYEKNAIFNNVTLPCQGNHDIFLAKYNSSGALTWIRTAGGITGDYAHCLAIDNSYVYIAGEIEGSGNPVKFIGSNITLYPKADNDIFVAKYDFNGNIMWAKRAGEYSGEKALGVTTDQNGNVFICGYFKNKTVIGTTTLYSSGGYEIFIAKLDPNGNWLWAKKAGGSGRDEAKAIKCDEAGNVYICGMHANGAKFDNQTLNTPDGYVNGYFAKYSNNGSLIWAKSIGGRYDDVAWSITRDTYGKMFISGQFNSSMTLANTNLNTTGGSDIFVAAYDLNGNAIWAKKAGGRLRDIARGIGTDGKNIFITGQYGGTATFGSVTKTAADSADIFISCLSNSGQFLWTTTAGGPADAFEDLGYESGNVICAEPNGNVYASGAMLNGAVFGGTSLSAYSRTDVFITKLTNNFRSKEDGSESEPIVLDGQVSNNNIVLNWVAAEQNDSLFYVIEKSVDSIHFEPLAQVEANVSNEYTYTDAQNSEANTYYRLAKTNYEGEKLYSNIITVEINNENCLQCSVYPNPTKNSFTVSLKPFGKQPTNNSFTTYLYDYLGAEQKHVNVNYGESVIDVSTLTAGIYLMVIRDGDKVIYEDKVVIQ